MQFIPIDKIRPGMVLGKDIKLYDNSGVHDLLLKGIPLRKANIERLKAIGSPGMYILEKDDPLIRPESIIDEKLKNETIIGIEKLFSDAETHHNRVNKPLLEVINNLSEKVVNSILYSDQYFTNILDLKMYDEYTYHHSLSVAILSTSIGLSLEFNKQQLKELGLCALLHDIGKTQVPIHLITKPARLSHDEFEIVKEHPRLGAEYLKKSSIITNRIYNGILSHHEKYDGTGYPFRTKGKDIPIFGRIIAIADVYDALTSNRPYRKPTSPSETIEYIMGGNGVMFDPEIVKVFLTKIAPYPINDYVRLSNGKIGLVTKIYSRNPLRPVVKIMGNGNETYDLFKDINCMNIVVEGNI